MHQVPVTVWPMESGPQGPGRPVEIGDRYVGIAESWTDVDDLLDQAGVPETAAVWTWIGGTGDVWE